MLEEVCKGSLRGVKINDEVLTHLLFIDDAILFARGIQKDLMTYKRILSLFFSATSMMVNLNKSSFQSNLFSVDLDAQDDALFSFQLKEFESGLKYLKFYLKPSCYRFTNWLWIHVKVEYWSSISKIHKGVLTKIRKSSMSYLWSSNKRMDGVPLVS